jgi:hypothetical protein
MAITEMTFAGTAGSSGAFHAILRFGFMDEISFFWSIQPREKAELIKTEPNNWALALRPERA